MGYVNRVDLASEIIEAGLKLFRFSSLNLIDLAIGNYWATGNIEKAKYLYEATADNRRSESSNEVEAPELSEVVQRLGLTEELIQRQLALAYESMTQRRRRFVAVSAHVLGSVADPETLILTLRYASNEEFDAELESVYVEKLIELPDWDPTVFSIRLTGHPVAEVINGN